ncbi:glycosyltransferase family 2 protein [Desertivirga arenae]|uniref:glycosyltransferase family 2 protein n=1 Tax=Desertivirga arenae TaxID=2810309 RepID=UPI001A966D41|nr:glycosyltransferase family 2 protein [Pedobacter sp. SYSU D00823]
MILCILIPAFNEEEAISSTIQNIFKVLSGATIDHNILVVNDNSTDNTELVLKGLCKEIPTLSYENNQYPRGFGSAVRYGLDNWQGDIVCIMMADASDNPEDAVHYYREINEHKFDCVFGSRFIEGGYVKNYPLFKLLLNRLFNNILSIVINKRFNDYTNAFKAYQRRVITGIIPLTSNNFSLTVEIPLKAIQEGFSYTVVPIGWTQRKYGYSKLNLFKNSLSYFNIFRLYLQRRL